MARPNKLEEANIIERLDALPGWGGDVTALKKTFKFADHITAMGFVTKVAICAEVLDHHPDLHIVYNTVDITLNTHDAGGVTELDFKLADKIEKYAS